MGRSGTGLGLAVVWGTVKDHNGYIDVQSEEGKGSVFSLYFPVTREIPQRRERSRWRKPSGRGESVLVVDDVKEQRQMATSILERWGIGSRPSPAVKRRSNTSKAGRADLVLLDMIMDPGIDGLETYQRIRTINPRQKVVIVSGYSETERIRKAQKLGAGAYVRKPYLMEKIGTAIRRELDRR